MIHGWQLWYDLRHTRISPYQHIHPIVLGSQDHGEKVLGPVKAALWKQPTVTRAEEGDIGYATYHDHQKSDFFLFQ